MKTSRREFLRSALVGVTLTVRLAMSRLAWGAESGARVTALQQA